MAAAFLLMGNVLAAPISADYKEVLSDTIERALQDPDLIRKVLSQHNTVVASSSWMERPMFGFKESHLTKLKQQALDSYQYFLDNTQSFDAISSAVSIEESSLCTKLEVVKTEETTENRKYYVERSYAQAFSLDGVFSYFFNFDEKEKSEYSYYHVKQDVKCVEEKRILRAVVNATPDFFKLNPQLLAGAVYSNYDKNKKEVLSVLEDANSRLLNYSDSLTDFEKIKADSYYTYMFLYNIKLIDFLKGLPVVDDQSKFHKFECNTHVDIKNEVNNWLSEVREVVKNHLRLYKADYEIQDEFEYLLNIVAKIQSNPKLTNKRVELIVGHNSVCGVIEIDMRSELRRLSRELGRVSQDMQ